jgi:hypothetical protein
MSTSDRSKEGEFVAMKNAFGATTKSELMKCSLLHVLMHHRVYRLTVVDTSMCHVRSTCQGQWQMNVPC